MKRYVREFANDVMMINHPRVKSGELRHPGMEDIVAVVRHCERGRILEKEAIRCIIDIDERCEGIQWNVA